MNTCEIVDRINARLEDARVEMTRLEGARAALSNSPSASSPRPRGRANARASKITNTGRRRRAVPLGTLMTLIRDAGGIATRELARETGGASSEILTLLKEQEAEGRIRRTGTRAGTRWHPVTDEDRVAAGRPSCAA